MKTSNLFPQGIAVGEAFCNRQMERQQFKQHILTTEHVVLMSPRRYGKTSLVTQVLTENKFPSCIIDFLPASNFDYVQAAIISSVSTLLTKILPVQKKLKERLLNIFAVMNPKIVLTAGGQKVELSPRRSSQKNIMEVLINLDKVAVEVKKKVVILMDEFQQLNALKDGRTIEASIRHAVEHSQNVSYIFSGNNRTLLTQMFSSKTRALYHLCRLINLGRIEASEYAKFIQKAAEKKWRRWFDNEVINEILNVTQCHPFRVNNLCRSLWKQDKCPDIKDVQSTWMQYVAEQRPFIVEDIQKLSPNQRSVLMQLARKSTQKPLGQNFVSAVKLSAGSIKQALSFLIKKDFVFRDKNRFYVILDPAISTYLQEVSKTIEYDV